MGFCISWHIFKWRTKIKMENKKKKLNDIKLLVILTCIASIMYSAWICMHYAADTYNIINVGYEKYANNWSLIDGRILMYLFVKFASFVNMPIELFVIFSLMLAIIISCILVIIIKNIIFEYALKKGQEDIRKVTTSNESKNGTEKEVGNRAEEETEKIAGKNIILVIVFFTIFNFMYIENMYFVEAPVMALSLLFFALSAKYIVEAGKPFEKSVKNGKNKDKIFNEPKKSDKENFNKYSGGKYLNSYLKAGIFAILGIISYQATFGFLILITLVFSIIKNPIKLEGNKENIKKNIIRIFKDVLVASIIVVISAIVNILLVKVIESFTDLKQTRVASSIPILNNLKYVFKNFVRILQSTSGLFPRNLFISFLAIILVIGFIYDYKTKFKNLIASKLGIVMLVGIASAFLVSIGTLSSFDTGRLRFCLGALIGFLFLIFFMEIEDEINGKNAENNNQKNNRANNESNDGAESKINKKVNTEKEIKFKNILIALVIIYAILNIINCIYITYEHKKVNENEKIKAMQIIDEINNRKIEENQKSNLYEITKDNYQDISEIAIYTKTNQTKRVYDDNIKIRAVPTYDALKCNWSADGVINFYLNKLLNKKLATVKINQELLNKYIQKYGADNPKGYGFIGNTLIIEAYMY